MAEYTLDSENVTARYDPDENILYVTYRGVMTPDVTLTYYRWIASLLDSLPPDVIASARGSIYDFRQVKQFASSNITTAQRSSQQINAKADLSNVPVALITETLLQTEWVRVTMKIMPGQERKRVVKSMEEAKAFLDEFRTKRAKEMPATDALTPQPPTRPSGTAASTRHASPQGEGE